MNGGEWHAHERREQRTEASGLLTALTSVPWSSCSVHRVSFPPFLRSPVGSSIPSLRPPDGTNDVSDVRWTEGGDGVGRDADVRGEQTQGYEAKRVRGMKGVSHSRYVHSTCLSSL